MTNFQFKNQSKSLSGNSFQEWVESFKTQFLQYCLASIVAFVKSDKYERGQIVSADALVAVFPSDDMTRLNFLADKKLWGRFNKPMSTLTKPELLQLIAGEEVTLSRKQHSFSLKLRNGKLAIQRAYKSNADSDLAVIHATGLLVDVSGLDLSGIANMLADKPIATKVAKQTDSVDLSDFD